MPNDPLISVVTPFYNTAPYLDQCITSVLGQTYRNFEYLLCDNCSTDGSTEIAMAHASRDPRIRYIRFDELLPQVENYNRALKQISPGAEWCKVVQADDWIYEQCLLRMIRVATLDPDIGIVSSFYLMGDDVYGDGMPIDTQILDGKDACRYQLRGRTFFMGSPTTVMYRAAIVRARDPFYSLNRYHEDTETAYDILEHSKLGFVHEVLSVLRIGNPSIISSLASFNFQILDGLIINETYAHRFLTAQEARALKRSTRRHYFMFLGARLFQLQTRQFWNYHRRGLETIGWRWSWTRVLAGALLVALKNIFNPLLTLQRFYHYVRTKVFSRA
jgi:glycosyltransferase involved in cell wall biosynthesis